ncbi:MAG TPA: CoA-binding protein [Smithellaceae bacterium]|mgnify:FL=1|nr:CoA-binding protein [Smithellaceae bacterium]HRV45177.1 CoA-binding protein [Smithellaceae bacterium]
MRPIRDILEAQSVVVIGASRDQEKPGAQLLKVLKEVGFAGRVAGVNPQGGEVFGVRLYSNVRDVPFEIDLAVLLIPPRFVPDALRDCAVKGVKGAVISAEGFAETGTQGAAYQEDVRAVLKSSGMRGFGPNTLGLVNTQTKLTTSYFADPRMLAPGNIGFAAQSGIFVGALLRYLSSLDGLHLSKGIGLGNKVDVNESDALSFLADDEQTKIIGLYLEDVKDGDRFAKNLKKATAKKPVLIIKSGRTQAGAKATASHTASMAVEDAVFDGIVRQAGAIRLHAIDEFVRTLKGFLNMPLPAGERLAFVTYSGAQAIMSIDTTMEQGLQTAKLAEATQARIGRVIATSSKTKNPIDIFPDWLAHGYEKTITEVVNALLDDRGVDGIVFISFAEKNPEVYRSLIDVVQSDRRKPVFASLLGDSRDKAACEHLLDSGGLPCYDLPEQAVRVFARMRQYAKIREKM